MAELTRLTDLTANVLYLLAGIFVILLVASGIVAIMVHRGKVAEDGELVKRVRTWWAIAVLFSTALALGKTASLFFLGFISFLALKEFFSIVPTRRVDRRSLFWAYLAIPIQYYWIADAWYGVFIIFIPVYMFFVLSTRMVMAGKTDGFLKSVGMMHWGLMIAVYGLSHLGYLLVLPEEINPLGDGPGLVLFLIVLTELNDVAQYIWGKSFGRHKIAPQVSPNKTWEGFLGGFATTLVVAYFLAPHLTPHSGLLALGAGAIIAVAGFYGDLTISAVKRDLGIKDSGSMLPGHGGILDRVDSLLFAAPLFFHYTYYFHY